MDSSGQELSQPLEEQRETIISFVKRLSEVNQTEINRPFGFRIWTAERFSFEQIKGLPFVEIGGPTIPEFTLYTPFFRTNDFTNIVTSNIEPVKTENVGQESRKNQPEFFANGLKMPISNESTQGIFVSCVPREIHKELWEEITRVLKPDGFLVFQGLGMEDLELFIQKYQFNYDLKLAQIHIMLKNGNSDINVNLILQKRKSNGFPIKNIVEESTLYRPQVSIYNYSPEDGHKLTNEEKIEFLKELYEKTLQLVANPEQTSDGRTLSSEEQLEWVKKNYPRD